MQKRSNQELIEGLVENFLQQNYQLSIEDLNQWYGYRLCQTTTSLQGEIFQFLDILGSDCVRFVTSEINNTKEYRFENIGFKPGDVVIDIGANVGMVSIFLAKRYPFLKIYSFEPVKINYDNFVKNIKLNHIPEGIITPVRCAVTSDGRPVTVMFNPKNSGGSGVTEEREAGYIIKKEDRDIPSITLNEIFEKYNIENVKLLKIDCEGSEHEILKKCLKKYLKKIENIRGEFHEDLNKRPTFINKELVEYLQKYVKNIDIVDLKIS